MSKTPEELAEKYTKDWWGNLPEAEGMRKSARENFLAGYKAAQEQLGSTSATLNNWISVKDRLPEQNLNVLAWIKLGTSQYPFIETASGNPEICSGWKHYNKDQVTHWQPLPEPPKEEG